MENVACSVSLVRQYITHMVLLHRDDFNIFANRADPDQAAHKSCLIDVYSVVLWKYDPTFVDLTSNFFVLSFFLRLLWRSNSDHYQRCVNFEISGEGKRLSY